MHVVRVEKQEKVRELDKARVQLLEENKRKRELIRAKELEAKAKKEEDEVRTIIDDTDAYI